MNFTEEEKAKIKQYGEYMESVGLYSAAGAKMNCWRYDYCPERKLSFWTVDLITRGIFSPSIYKFSWIVDGVTEPKLTADMDGTTNLCYKPKDFEEFKQRIDETVAKFHEYDKYKKQILENRRIKELQKDFNDG